MWKTSPYQKASIQGVSPVKVFLKFTGDHTETEKMKKYRDKISSTFRDKKRKIQASKQICLCILFTNFA